MKLLQVRRLARAFSLVEVMLSLGIISFAFVGLLGLIPLGLDMFRTAVDATVEAQILQCVTTVARQGKFSQLQELDRNPGQQAGVELPDFFFDEQGGEITDPHAIQSAEYIYTAAVLVKPVSTVPTGSRGEAINANVATVNIFIRRESAPRDVRLASIFIANNGL
jgi:uncharacterized protein (TIGR02598 family)